MAEPESMPMMMETGHGGGPPSPAVPSAPMRGSLGCSHEAVHPVGRVLVPGLLVTKDVLLAFSRPHSAPLGISSIQGWGTFQFRHTVALLIEPTPRVSSECWASWPRRDPGTGGLEALEVLGPRRGHRLQAQTTPPSLRTAEAEHRSQGWKKPGDHLI